MGANMKISQKTIAEQAGVSRGTVDRVLHGKPNVKPETRERVLAAVEALGYTPNMVGRALALSRREYSVCVVLPDNPFFADVRAGIEAARAELCDYNVTVSYIVTNGKSNAELIKAITDSPSKAFMVALGDTEDIRACIRRKTEAGIPVITFNTDIKDCGRLCFVGQDLYRSGRIAASLMLKMLHGEGGRVLILTGSNKYKAHRERAEGFGDVMADSGRSIELITAPETEDDRELTRIRLLDALEADKSIDGIYMASGHVEELAKVLSSLGRKYRVVVNDLYPSVAEALCGGVIDFTILQDPFAQGYKPIKLIFEYLFNGNAPSEEYCFTDSAVITGEML